MISIDVVYKTVLTIANSDIRGNATPNDIRLLINDVVNEIYEDYFDAQNKLQNRENKGYVNGGLANLVELHQEKIQHFLVPSGNLTYASNLFSIPANARYIETVYYNGIKVELVKSSKELDTISRNKYAKPTVTMPIGLRIGDKYKIAPSTITSNVTCYYLRKPLIANWTYTVVGDAELFNPSATGFQDIDLHPSEENNVVLKTLNRLGINLKESDLQNITMNKEQIEFNQNNAV